MGNLLSLRRDGDISGQTWGMVDSLSITYDGTRVACVADAATAAVPGVSMDFRDGASAPVEYAYDAAGRMTADLNRGISSVTYSACGLPASVRHGDVLETYAHLPDGTKMSRTVSSTDGTVTVTDYRGNLVLVDGRLEYILLDGGLVSMAGDSPEYIFFLRDHLGSTRVAATADGDPVQVLHYYPYGAAFATNAMAGQGGASEETAEGDGTEVDTGGVVAGPGSGDDDTDLDDGALLMQAGLGLASVQATPPASQQPYRFLGNELYSDSGLGLYDFHARLYDPALGRFLAPDPLAGKYPELSPYAYCGGSPVRYVDKDGKFPGIANVVAGVSAAAIDFGAQLITSVDFDNKTFSMALKDAIKGVDYADVIMSGLEGFLTMGASIGKSIIVKSVVTATSSVVNFDMNDGLKYNDPTTALAYSIIAVATDGIGKGHGLNVPTTSPNKAVNAARAAAHAEGNGLTREDAKRIYANKKRVNKIVQSINEGSERGTEGDIGSLVEKVGDRIVKQLNEDYEKIK